MLIGTLSFKLGRCPYAACGCYRLRAAGNARQHATMRGPATQPQGRQKSPTVVFPIHSLTLDRPIESTRSLHTHAAPSMGAQGGPLGAFGTRQGASIAAPNAPGRWTLDCLGPFLNYGKYTVPHVVGNGARSLPTNCCQCARASLRAN
jgi:hypothetical protein